MSEAAPRDRAVDALRGVALFGIILVNGPFFAGPAALIPAAGGLDLLAQALVAVVFARKFFPIYSFLFGFGLARLIARGAPAGRRLIGLGAFGALHAVFLFYGDILLLYALLGPFVVLAARASDRVVIAAGAVLLVLGIGAQVAITQATQELWMEALRRPVVPGQGYLGGFGAVTAERLADLPSALSFTLVFNGQVALAMMLFGLVAARAGAFPPDPARRRPVGILAAAGLAASLLGTGLYAAAPESVPQAELIGLALTSLGAPPLAGAIILAVAGWAAGRPDHRLVRLLAGVGTQALTGYLLHSVLFGALFYGWGLGLYGRPGAGLVLALSIGVYVAIVVAVSLLGAAFGRGPAERLLRVMARG